MSFGTVHIWASSPGHALYSDNYKLTSGEVGVGIPMPRTVTVPKASRSFRIDLGIKARYTSGARTYAYKLVPKSISDTPLRLSTPTNTMDLDHAGDDAFAPRIPGSQELFVCVDNMSDSDLTVTKHSRPFKLVPIGLVVDNQRVLLYAEELAGQHFQDGIVVVPMRVPVFAANCTTDIPS